MSDRLNQQTILDFQRGEEKAFESIYKGYYTSIVAYAIKITTDQHEAEDIASEIFRGLFQRYDQFENEKSIRAFLYVSVRNRCLNYLKAKKRRTAREEQFIASLPDDTLLAYEYEIKAELLQAIHQAIEKFPEKCRETFKLLYFEELNPEEVAKKLKISVNTVYVHKSRALTLLRLHFSQNRFIIIWLIKVLYCCW